MRYRHKDKITLKRKKAAIVYYKKLKSEKENADKQARNNKNINPENLAIRIQYLKKSINSLIDVACACDILGIQIPKRLFDQIDNKIGFKKNSREHYCGLTYNNNDCEILYFDDRGVHFSFNEYRISYEEPGEISEINTDILQDFIHNFAVFESMFYKWFDDLVGFQYFI